MTAILLNDGEIAAPRLENASWFLWGGGLPTKYEPGGQKYFFPGGKSKLLHEEQRAKSL